MQVYIDADGCPVVDITIAICKERNVPVTIVCDTSHFFSSDYADVVTVDKGSDSADMKVANLAANGDIVITQDYGLAAMCLAKRCICLSQNGMVYDESNIDSLLLSRHIAKKIRRSGGKLKGPHKRTNEENEKFKAKLIDILNKIQKEG